MNKILKFSSAIALILCVGVSCTDLKVNEIDSVVLSSDDTFKPIDPTAGLVTLYKDLAGFTNQANTYAMETHSAAEMIPPTRGTDWGDNGVWRSLDQHTWNSTHGQVHDTWYELNQHAYKATIVLASNPTPAQAAEAKFCRAFNMFHIVDLYGQVLFRQTTDAPLADAQVLDRPSAYAQIVKDLTEAIPALSSGKPDAARYTATKEAAYFLLARMALNKAVYTGAAAPYTFAAADMDEVIKNVDLITAAGYSLDNSYFTNFSPNEKKEAILMCHPDGNPQNRWFMTLHYNQNPSGWNGFTTLSDFYKTFDDVKDQRLGLQGKRDSSAFSGLDRGFLRGQQYSDNGVKLFDRKKNLLVFTDDIPLSGANEVQGIRVIKYHPSDAKQYNFMRYSEAFLMKAEAMFRKGDAAGALAMVNTLRTTRGASALTSALTADILFAERRRELYWEGYGRTDEIRFGKFTSGPGVVNKADYTTLYPIPASALASNPNLKQNTGY